ncbi:MAG: hypothetical protein I8H77_08340 [Comamonadaceae bacterium]|nr:hypothetical protein [Comamonadaceae bacterium]
MSQRAELAARREQLLLRSAQLREQLAHRSRVVQPAFRAADKVREGASWVQSNPALIAVVGAALLGAAAARPKAMMGLGLRAWSGWQMFQRVRPVANAFLRQIF